MYIHTGEYNKIAVFIHKYFLQQKITQSIGGLTDVAMVCPSDGVQLFTLEMDTFGVIFSAEGEESHSDL